MCQCFNVSRSGYYAWLQRKPSQRLQQRQRLDEQLKTLFHKHKQRYGAERLQQKMVSRMLQQHDLLGSMSAKGNCYDNACAESFFHSLKVEAIHGEQFDTREVIMPAYAKKAERVLIFPSAFST